MQRYRDLVELARLCWRQAQTAQTEGVAHTFRQMATEYLQEAAKLDGGEVPDIGYERRRPPAER
jgi:hypothetical protein